MEVKWISHFQKFHFLQSVKEKHYSNTGSYQTFAGNCYTMHQWEEKKNRRYWSICNIDTERFSWPENRSGNFFTTRGKNIEWVCTKQYDVLFPSARSHGNKWLKDFMKEKFNEWFATQLRK